MVTLKEKKYKQFEKDMQIVPVGPEGGVGVLFWVECSELLRVGVEGEDFHVGEGSRIGCWRRVFKALIECERLGR